MLAGFIAHCWWQQHDNSAYDQGKNEGSGVHHVSNYRSCTAGVEGSAWLCCQRKAHDHCTLPHCVSAWECRLAFEVRWCLSLMNIAECVLGCWIMCECECEWVCVCVCVYGVCVCMVCVCVYGVCVVWCWCWCVWCWCMGVCGSVCCVCGASVWRLYVYYCDLRLLVLFDPSDKEKQFGKTDD